MAFFPYFLILFSLSLCNPTYELTEDRIEIMNNFIKSQMELAKVDTLGLIVTNKSKTIYKKIYGVNTKAIETTPFVLGSVSKSFTALGLLKLNIPLNDTLDKYKLGNYINEEDSKKITVGELLNHTSGLISFGSKVVNENKGNFSYSNYGFALLGKIIEEKSGKTYNEYMKEAIFNPLKMNDTEAIYRDNIVDSYDTFLGFNTKYTSLESEIGDGFYVPAGFISSSIEDMGKYLRLYLNKDSEDYKKYISQMIKGSINYMYNDDYGMGMFVKKKNGQTVYYHPGGTNSFSSYLYVYPSQDLGIFIIINSNNKFCSTPVQQLFDNIENFIVFDTYDSINSTLFLFVHFSLDVIFIIVIAMPLIYLIITIVRKCKKKKFTWFIGCKGITIFIIELVLLMFLPITAIIFLYNFNPDIRYALNNTKDLKFALFTACSALILTFLIKLVYSLVFNKYFKSIVGDSSKKIESMDLDYMGVEEDK